MANSK